MTSLTARLEYVEKVAKTDVADKIPNDWLENALKRELSEEENKKFSSLVAWKS